MHQLLTELRYDKETRVIVLTGTGDHFCAGQDLKQYSLEMDSQPEWVRDEIREKVRKWRTELLRTMPQPVIARVTGWCLGGALTVVAGCDVAIASDDATFGLPEVNFGGKMMSARDAERIGLISTVVARADLDHEVDEFAKCLAEKSPLALKAVKEAWYYSTCASPDVAFAISNFISQRIVRDEGGRPGLEQFVQKRLRPVSGVMKTEKE
jgi:trans-feruloyl-CoA hydratase/vanillin synthase